MSASSKQRTVIKLGTGILTLGIGQLDTLRIREICAQVAQLKKNGQEVIIVSSGAVGMGMGRLHLQSRPTKLSTLQKCAAVGQSILIETWQTGFTGHGITVAQILLTREDFSSESRRGAVRDLMDELLADGIVPIVNENDCISAEEIKFGDNDQLSALVAELTSANTLIILSTIIGLLNLETNELLTHVPELTPEIEALAQGTQSSTAVGGMVSKLLAAKICFSAGVELFIGHGKDPQILQDFFAGTAVGTLFRKTTF